MTDMSPLVVIAFASLCMLQAKNSVSEALAALKRNPTDSAAISTVINSKVPEGREVLAGVFPVLPDEDPLKSVLAIHLFNRTRNDLYFDWLFARAKVAVDTALPLTDFPSGPKSLDELPPGFLTACKAASMDIPACVTKSLYGDPAAVRSLAIVRDSRSYELFRKGMESENLGLIYACSAGLGLLRRPEAIPVIEHQLQVLPRESASIRRRFFLEILGDFHAPGADAIIDRYETDPALREYYKKGSQLEKIADLYQWKGPGQ